MAFVYLLHFDKPFWSNAQHYVGYTKLPLQRRIRKHRNGTGSLLVRYALQKKGCKFKLAMSEEYPTPGEARERELQLKALHGLKKICPICKG
jgi:predicted GIY-YIG superfamily endonuclease